MIPTRAPALRLLLAILLPLAAGCSNFHTVDEGRLYRAAQPSGPLLDSWIDRYEIRTVLRLRSENPDDPEFREEAATCEARGVELLGVPMSGRNWPTRETLLALCDAIEGAEYPMLVHCRSGVDRSGLVSGIYMILHDRGLDAAKGQLSFYPYGYTGWLGADAMIGVLEQYEAHQPPVRFREWIEEHYRPPVADPSTPEEGR